MKKNQLRTLITLLCVALLLGGVLAALSFEKAPQVLPPLVRLSQGQITAMEYTSRAGSFRFEKQGGLWSLTDDPDFPVNGTLVQNMLTVLCSAVPQGSVEAPDREELGLTAPQCTISVTADTATQEFVIGSMNAVTGQLYVQTEDTVYLTDTALLQAFSGSLLDLALQETVPTPNDQQRVQITNAQNTVVLSCVGSETGGEDGVWYVQKDGSFLMADQDKAYNYYFLTWDIHWLSTAGYIQDAAQLADYGLDAPQVRYDLTYGGKTFQLLLGSSLPDGTTYAMCAGGNLVYTVDSVLVQWLSQATFEAIL